MTTPSAPDAADPMPRPSATTPADPRWRAVLARDARADGSFLFGVTTTGVFCRPSCPSRRARPEHVRFFATAAEARAAGLRACLRCRPERPPGELAAARIVAICRHLDAAESPPTLAALADLAGLSPHHLQRTFKAALGISPREYFAARRARRVADALSSAPSVTAALHDAGYGSSSRFYAESTAVLGMTPTRARAGGRLERIAFALGRCSLGQVLVARTESGICAVLLGDDAEGLEADLARRFPRAQRVRGGGLDATLAAVIAHVDAPASPLDLPLDLRGTAFQRRVWALLRTIPAGQTVTYAELSSRLGAPAAHRAVARACAANPAAVLVPCHRVVRAGGDLAGYRWGLPRKRALLDRERQGS